MPLLTLTSLRSLLIILTFEVFWIVVFLLNRIANEASNIPEFVYVNF